MKQQVFSVYDTKAGAHCTPFFCSTVGLGMRAFQDAVNAADTTISKNPGDFCLFLLGEWDDETAVFKLLPEHKNLGLAANFKKEIERV